MDSSDTLRYTIIVDVHSVYYYDACSLIKDA